MSLLTMESGLCVVGNSDFAGSHISTSSKTRRLTSRNGSVLNHSVVITLVYPVLSCRCQLPVSVGIQIHPVSLVFSVIIQHCCLNFVHVNKTIKEGISICAFKGKKVIILQGQFQLGNTYKNLNKNSLQNLVNWSFSEHREITPIVRDRDLSIIKLSG